MILCDGQLVFDGSPSQLKSRLKDLGFETPKFMTLIDFFMKIIDKDEIKIQYENTYGEVPLHDPRIIDKLYNDRIKLLLSQEKSKYPQKSILSDVNIKNNRIKYHYKDPLNNILSQKLLSKNEEDNFDDLELERKTRNQKLNQFSQFLFLTKLNMSKYYRQPSTYLMLFFQSVIAHGFIGLVYRPLGLPGEDTLVAIQNRFGLMFMIVLMTCMSGMQSSLVFYLQNKRLFLKDKDSRLYDQVPFFLANIVYTIPISMVVYLGVVAFYFYFLDLNQDPEFARNFLYLYLFVFVGCVLVGNSYSVILALLADNLEQVSTLVVFILMPLLVCCGFVVNVKSSTWPIVILSYISPMRFAFQGLLLNEFQNYSEYTDSCYTRIPCLFDPSKQCRVKVPEQFKEKCDPLKVMDFYEMDMSRNIYYLLGLLFLINLIGFLILKIRSSWGKMRYKTNQGLRIMLTHFDEEEKKSFSEFEESKGNSK